MARPRKDAEGPCARARLVEAFWELLDQGTDADLSVGAVTRIAGCNRGTFYYHFKDIDELQRTAIGQLLLDDGALVDELWHAALAGDVAHLLDQGDALSLHRLVIAMESGSAHLVDRTVRRGVLDRWKRAVLPDGGELAPDACFAIQFMLSGIMSMVVAMGYSNEGMGPVRTVELGSCARAYLLDVASATADAVAAAQHMDRADLIARLR